MSLQKTVEMALHVIKASEDYSDNETIEQFMLVQTEIMDNPLELRSLSSLKEQDEFGAVIVAMTVSNFFNRFPWYYNKSTGKIVCAAGYFFFMNRLEKGEMFDKNFPMFVVLLHYGRKYLSEIFEQILFKRRNFYNPYNVLDRFDSHDNSRKAAVIVKAIELMIINAYKRKGFNDDDLNRFAIELQQDSSVMRELSSDINPFEQGKKVYQRIGEWFESDSPFEFAED